MTDRKKVFGLVVEQVECFTFTVAHAVAAMGWRVVIFADPERSKSAQNKMYIQHVSRLPGVSIEMGFQPTDLDLLYVELTRLTPRDRVNYYCRRAKRVGILTYCRRSSSTRTMLAELMDSRGCLRCVLRARRFVYVEGYRPIDLFGFLGIRQHLGIDVHSDFLVNPPMRDMIFALDWEPHSPRRYGLSYMGSRLPESRNRIIQEVEAKLQQLGTSLARSPEQEGDVVWFVGATVHETAYCQLTTESDYTLCPPGFLRLTHRVVEVLLRGSIPILHADELPLYDLDLQSGKNCIAVSSGKWGDTVAAALDADLETRIRMRNNILEMREMHLAMAASNLRICRNLGIDG